MHSYSNFRPLEGNVTTEITLTFDFRIRQITIINDSPTNGLNFKFNPSESYGTLGRTETVSLPFNSKTIIIKSDNGTTTVPYRIWGIG